ncbi:unnamed protein product [Didymodactylos carnosus]|uniref:Cytochrome P450 n=1 Tax=Didymodactylos carnosus TaxID=1234261 RepID=A0A816AZA0_9BILA|nr:unnamed protein product [Didymodactylos carnosus]CAF1602729.1 unnamed protein product [Didymodactylos carnosus]CAF3768263.1 unnamed protein product [Didymodactylos carnosus]CAF4480850.1 unnamed protein product [Didymodactylos carnosus]
MLFMLLITTLLLYLAGILVWKRLSARTSHISITDASTARKILKSPSVYQRHPNNKWMVTKLGICNGFVIEDIDYQKRFTATVHSCLLRNNTKYKYLLKVVNDIITEEVVELEELILSRWIQKVTLYSFSKTFLNLNPSVKLLNELPTLINEIWLKQKTGGDTQTLSNDLFRLLENEIPSQVLNNNENDNWTKIQNVMVSVRKTTADKLNVKNFDNLFNNVLNIVIPGYESMWSLIFYTMLELLRRPALLEELRDGLLDDNNRLLRSIIQETLRLYPPSRSIHRTRATDNAQVVIDINKIHRNTVVWGIDSHLFNPNRFRKLTDSQSDAYLPFSITCPSRQSYTYRFSGAIISQIIDKYQLRISHGNLPPVDTPLNSNTRQSYGDIMVQFQKR